MADQPNEADFVVNERPGEYDATIEVCGRINVTIKAESLEEARAKAEALVEDDGFGLDLDDDEISVRSVCRSRPMYLVMRDGAKMQVSHLVPGDVPRQPDERGF
ncbi:hypothetical protein IB276_10905 [Ensifer sp. ENS04]|nr:hypothetical protein [Ensifer sp. ENS04]